MRNLMLNLQRNVCTFLTKICDSIKSYGHNCKKQPRQEVEDGYIIVNIFVKEQSDYLTNIFLWCIEKKSTVIIDPNIKPGFFIQSLKYCLDYA